MRPLRTTLCALWLLWPAPVAAQAVTASPFAARNLALDGAPTLAGLAVTGWFGAVGLRAGGALDVGSGPAGRLLGRPAPAAPQAWSAEADLRVRGGPLGLSIGGIEPGAFVGFGIQGVRRDGEPVTVPAWSYGADASLRLAEWLSLDGEGRYRMLHSDDPVATPGVGGGWELRAGLSVHLGRRARRTRPVPSPRPPRSLASRSGPSAGDRADLAGRMLTTGERYVGVPYAWGGAHPSEGFDCSGFVQYVYGRHGVSLPRVSRDQARAGARVTPVSGVLETGDLLFFAGEDGVIDHVAIYAGDGWILHASSSRGAVAWDRLDSRRARWFADHLVSARRVLP